MKYKLNKIGRTVVLDDNIVAEYEKVRELRENTFVISLSLRYGDSLGCVSDEELSDACNKALVDDLEAMIDNAVVVQYLREHRASLLATGWADKATEVDVPNR